jgi:hypothetical protein
VREAKAINAIRGLELAFGNQCSFVVTRNDSSVDRTLNVVTLDGKSEPMLISRPSCINAMCGQ